MDVRLTNVLVGDARLLADGLLQPEDDMAVFVGRGGRGRVAPFTVRRSYTGAGGWYVESIALLAPNGDVPWRGREQPITLRGSNKIDTFSDDVHGVVVDYADDYELVFLIGNDEVGRVPVAVLDEDPPYASASQTGVLNEVLKKSTIIWVEVPGPNGTGERAVPVWFGTMDGRIYVLTGGSEQRVRGLDQADQVLLSARSKDLQSLLTRIDASARVIPASDPLFARVVPVLLPRRLNLPDGEHAADRWRKECTLVELTPSAIPAEA
jgi:hypothetical protein